MLTTFYQTSFENGLGDEWTIFTPDSDARVAIRDLVAEGVITNEVAKQFSTPENRHSLAFDSTRASGDSDNDLGVAVLSVDLTGMTEGLLLFQQWEDGDENSDLPDVHSLTTHGDGLAVSQDGVTWYALQNLQRFNLNRNGDGYWQQHEYDLDAEFERINAEFSAGLSFDSNVQFKFSQSDNFPLPTDGWAIDELLIVDNAAEFSLARSRGVFHRYSLASEDDEDYYFRAAVYGTPDENTPILISVHGANSDGRFADHPWIWHKFVSDPANEVDSLIVVTPAYVSSDQGGRFNIDRGFNALSWNPNSDAAADLVLLETVDHISSFGIGDAQNLRLWGYSAGGQFSGRFTAAHPDRVAATVVGGPSTHILPDETISFPFGFGTRSNHPAPDGVTLELDEFLKSRIMYWVGQDDNDPNHSQLQRNPSADVQGVNRIDRVLTQTRAMTSLARNSGLSDDQYQFEAFISEGDGHGWAFDDAAEIYEFLMRDNLHEDPVTINPVLVSAPTSRSARNDLPAGLDFAGQGDTAYLEIWIDQGDTSTQVDSGLIEIYFDEDVIQISGIDHGAFMSNTSAILDAPAGRIRQFGGTRTGQENDQFVLCGRIEITINSNINDVKNLPIAIQRTTSLNLITSTGPQRTEILPLEVSFLKDEETTLSTRLHGTLFSDSNGNMQKESTESTLSDYFIGLFDESTGSVLSQTITIEPDDDLGSRAFLSRTNPWATLTAVGSEPLNPGVRAFTRSPDEASTGILVFGHELSTGGNTQWQQDTRNLRVDFTQPAKTVSIDVIAKLSNSDHFGTISAYGTDNTLLATTTSSALRNGQSETMVVTRDQFEIAYVIVSGIGTRTVRLDHLEFEVPLVFQTEEDGHFTMYDLPSGLHHVVASPDFHFPAENTTSIPVLLEPGERLTGFDFPIPDPEINVQGNGNDILEGDTTPSLTDGTDFGSTSMSVDSVTHTFNIQNTGNVDLTVTGITLGGANADEFSVSGFIPGVIGAGGTLTFDVSFDPNTNGTKTATISIVNNDVDENPYTFAISGTGYIPDTSVTIDSGILTIRDSQGGTSNDNLVLSFADGLYTLEDLGGLLIDATPIAGSIGSGTNTVLIPETEVEGIIFDTLGGGDIVRVESVQELLPGGFVIDNNVAWFMLNADINAMTADVSIDVSGGMVLDSGSITTTDGDINLSGNLTSTTPGDFRGIFLDNFTLHSSGSGDITLTGFGGTAGASRGVDLAGTTLVNSSGTGAITISGQRGDGAANGINDYGFVMRDATHIASTFGDINITGLGSPTGQGNQGIAVFDGSVISATGEASISLIGTGGTSAAGFNHGVIISQTTDISAVDGDISITGTSGTGANSLGVAPGNLRSTGSGNVTVTASGRTDIVGFGPINLDAGPSGTLTLNIDSLFVVPGTSFTGAGDLVIKPRTPGTSIGIGAATGLLNLDDTILSFIQDGFDSITIGDVANGTGLVTLDTATFTDNVTIAGGTIHDRTGTDLNAGDNDVTLIGNVAPGQSPGILTITGQFHFIFGEKFVVEILGSTPGSQHDQLSVSGTVDLNYATLEIDDRFFTGPANTIVLVNNDGDDPIQDVFNALPEGGAILVGGFVYTISYVGGDGNDVVLNPWMPSFTTVSSTGSFVQQNSSVPGISLWSSDTNQNEPLIDPKLTKPETTLRRSDEAEQTEIDTELFDYLDTLLFS